MESLVQTGSDSDRTPIPLSPSVPSKLHRSWSGKKRNGSNSEMDSTGGKGDKNKRSSKYIYDIQGGHFLTCSMFVHFIAGALRHTVCTYVRPQKRETVVIFREWTQIVRKVRSLKVPVVKKQGHSTLLTSKIKSCFGVTFNKILLKVPPLKRAYPFRVGMYFENIWSCMCTHWYWNVSPSPPPPDFLSPHFPIQNSHSLKLLSDDWGFNVNME